MLLFSESSGSQTPHHIKSVLSWQAQACLACNRSNPESAPVFWQMQHYLPAFRLQLAESLLVVGAKKSPTLPLPFQFSSFVGAFSVFYLGGHRRWFGDGSAQEMFRFLCNLAAVMWLWTSRKIQMGFGARWGLVPEAEFLAMWDRNLKKTKPWDGIASHEKAQTKEGKDF